MDNLVCTTTKKDAQEEVQDLLALSEQPLRLFDDVAAEFDEKRRALMASFVDDVGAFVTNPGPELFGKHSLGAAIYNLEREERRAKADQVKAALTRTRGIAAQAARLLGANPAAVRQMIQEFPDVATVKRQMIEGMKDTAEGGLYDAIEQRDLRAIFFFLRTQGKDRGYVERSERVVEGSGMPSVFQLNINTSIRRDHGEDDGHTIEAV